MKLKKIISVVMAAAMLLTCAAKPELAPKSTVISASATILDTETMLNDGETKVIIPKTGDQIDYKIEVKGEGRIIIDFIYSMSCMEFQFYNSVGQEIIGSYSIAAGSRHDYIHDSAYNRLFWNSNIQVGSGTVSIAAHPGTYYLKLTRHGGDGSGSCTLNVSLPPIISVGKGKAGVNSATIAWVNIPGATKYGIRNITLDKEITVEAVSGDIGSYVWSGLTSGKTYVFQVRPYLYDSTWGSYSKNITVAPIDLKAPEQPAQVKATAGPNKATVVCSSVKGCTNYRLFYTTNNGQSYTRVGDSDTRKWVVNKLKSGVTYKWLVLAYNGKWSTYKKGECYSPVVPTISKPEIIKSVEGSKKVVVTCSSVSGAKKYRLFYTTNRGSTYKLVGDSTTRKWTVTGLKSGVTYRFLVLAYDGKSWSKYTKGESYAPATPY